MFMPAYLGSYTAEMVRALNDRHDWGWPRYEVVDGELLVSPSARKWHQVMVQRLSLALGEYTENEQVGQVFIAPADISWGTNQLVQPDVFVIPLDEARTPEWSTVSHLLLAIEVLSPSTARSDRIVKRRLYQRQGVPLYWMVDADAEVVEIWTPGTSEARQERDALVWNPPGASAPFRLALSRLFRPI